MDHFYPLTPPMDGTHLESWTMLAALAQATTRLRLGAMVNGMHYRHPAITANMAVTVDHISDGRFVLGLGAGWFDSESDAYGIPLGSLKDRFDRLDEGVQVIRSLLDNEHTTFSGRYYELTEARCEPKPVQAHLPIVDRRQGQAPHAADRRSVCRSVGRDVPARRRVLARPRRDDALVLRRGRARRGRDHALDPSAVVRRRRSATTGGRRAAVLRGGRRPRDLLDARAVRGASASRHSATRCASSAEVVQHARVVDEDPVAGRRRRARSRRAGRRRSPSSGMWRTFGCGQSVPHSTRSGAAAISALRERHDVVVRRRAAGGEPLGAGDLDPAALVGHQRRAVAGTAPARRRPHASTRAMWSITYGARHAVEQARRSEGGPWRRSAARCASRTACTRSTIRQNSSSSGAPPRWATKLNRVPRTPASCSSAMSASVNDSSIIATPA